MYRNEVHAFAQPLHDAGVPTRKIYQQAVVQFPDKSLDVYDFNRRDGRGYIDHIGCDSKRCPEPKTPCEGCPHQPALLVGQTCPPQLSLGSTALTVVVPGGVFRGPLQLNQLTVTSLAGAGLTMDRVTVLPAVRCAGDAWAKAAKRCHKLSVLERMLSPGLYLALGKAAFDYVVGDADVRFQAFRGTWCSIGDVHVYPVDHPNEIMTVQDAKSREARLARFTSDVARCVDRVLDREVGPPVDVEIFDSPVTPAARDYLRRLGQRTAPWAFDIESYDGAKFPGRREIATDPFHPDFRLRGVAIAEGPKKGAWLELKGWDGNPEAREALDQAFGSDAAKWAFNGHFDASGLVYGGTVTAVRNRAGDGMLAAVTLSDGLHDSLRLEKLVLRHLNKPMGWAVDKSRMRDLPVDMVGRGAVTDACRTFELCMALHRDLSLGRYHSGD